MSLKSNGLHVDVQNEIDWSKGEGVLEMCVFELYINQGLRTQIHNGTLVFLWTRNRKEETYDAYPRRKRTSRISSNKCVGPRILEKTDMWRVIDSLQRICRMQSCCFAQPVPSTRSVSTEQLRIGVENWLSTSLIMHFPNTSTLVAKMKAQLECRLSPEVVCHDQTACDRRCDTGKPVAKS